MSLSTRSDPEILAWIGERLKAVREQQGLTSLEAAAQAGLSRRTVYRAEHGENPTLLTVVRLLRLYGRLEGLGQLMPEPEISPMALLDERARPKRRRARRGGA